MAFICKDPSESSDPVPVIDSRGESPRETGSASFLNPGGNPCIQSCLRTVVLSGRPPSAGGLHLRAWQVFKGLVLGFLILTLFGAAQPAWSQAASSTPLVPEHYLQDSAGLVKDTVRAQILAAGKEIEDALRIRVLIRTEVLADINQFPQRVEIFFLDWIRSIDLDKRGLLIFAGLSKDSLQGKVSLRAGIGLKYLITQEMGERILNRVILPNNAEKNDGKAFLEGVLAIRGMLLDEFKREQHRQAQPTESFDLFSFLWKSKEIILVICFGCFLCYLVFFVERCPRCNGNLKVSEEMLKEPGQNTLGLRRRVFQCSRCGFSRRRKEPVYPSGRSGFWMWLNGARRNVKITPISPNLPTDLSKEDRHTPPE